MRVVLLVLTVAKKDHALQVGLEVPNAQREKCYKTITVPKKNVKKESASRANARQENVSQMSVQHVDAALRVAFYQNANQDRAQLVLAALVPVSMTVEVKTVASEVPALVATA